MDGGPVGDFAMAPAALVPGLLSMVGYRTTVRASLHRGLPSASLTFLLGLDDGVVAGPTPAAAAEARPLAVLLAGLHTTASSVRQDRRQVGIQMAVHPLAARALFGVPAAELSTIDYDGAAVLGADARRLHEQVAAAPDWSAAFLTVARYAADARRTRERTTVRRELALAWRLLARSGGTMPVGRVAERVGLGPRRLEMLFRAEVGHGPKTVAGLMRFSRATSLIARAVGDTGTVDLASVAARTGFCDQSHLTRDFVRHCGIPPRRWIAEEFANIQDGGHRGWEDSTP